MGRISNFKVNNEEAYKLLLKDKSFEFLHALFFLAIFGLKRSSFTA